MESFYMKKFIAVFIINIIFISIGLFIIEVITWGCENMRMVVHKERYACDLPIKFHAGVIPFKFDLDAYPSPEYSMGRYPAGLDYKNKPIVVFGDSYAYGFDLEHEQTFHYKLAELTKRPTYLRAVSGWGIQNMLYQVREDEFYKKVPEPEYVIYIMIKDHFRRLYSIHFMSGCLLEERRCLRYKDKNGELVQITDENPVLNFIKRIYFVNKIHEYYINRILLNPNNYELYSNFAVKHFAASKEAMEKHWKNTKYVILIYEPLYNGDIFIKDLKKLGFTVISIPDIVDVNLRDELYMLPNYHPTEAAWDLIVPKVIEELSLNKKKK